MTWLKNQNAKYPQGSLLQKPSPAKNEGHGGKPGHEHLKAMNKKDIPLNEQKATASDSLAIKMDYQAKQMGFPKSNWSDVATESKKIYPNIDPSTYKVSDIKGTTNAKKARAKYGL